jgi:hypothetical protein
VLLKCVRGNGPLQVTMMYMLVVMSANFFERNVAGLTYSVMSCACGDTQMSVSSPIGTSRRPSACIALVYYRTLTYTL